MGYEILKQYDQVANFVDQVSYIADQNKESFGFLSSSVYSQMASKGQLWIAINSAKELKGYLMFGGTMPTVKVFQIYVSESAKGHGVAKKLINALKEHARERHYHTISARVASDLPANGFWESVGFHIHRQIDGGQTKKRVINIRGYSLGDNDLFGGLSSTANSLTPSGPMLGRPVYALDLNLLFDVFEARLGYEKVIKLMQTGFQGGISLCITPEFKKELERQSVNFRDDLLLRLAEVFPELRTDGDVSNVAESLRNIVFPCRASTRRSAQNDESDLMHLAYCISAGVGGFVTREKALLRACSIIKDKYNVSVLSPDELILDDGNLLDITRPLNTDFSFNTSPITTEIRNFLEGFAAAKVISDRLFSTSPVNDEGVIYEARHNGGLFGVYFFQKPIKSTENAIACLYVDESCPKAMAAIDHFLEKALRYKCKFSYRLDLYIGMGQDLTEDTLRKKGFLKSEDHFVKIICNLFLDNSNWAKFAKDIKSFCGFSIPDKLPSKKELIHTGIGITDSSGNVEFFSWFDFETLISPRFILNTARKCILVPIRENYANGLIGNIRNQQSLLSSHDKSLLLEKAYFRSTSKASLFKKGGIVAFYVSGSKSIQEVIGFARITYSEVVNIDAATVKVDRQGVLSRSELAKLTNKTGKLHVFTFDNFLEFDSRVPFGRAKQLSLISNANLVSPEIIDSNKFNILIGEAFHE